MMEGQFRIAQLRLCEAQKGYTHGRIFCRQELGQIRHLPIFAQFGDGYMGFRLVVLTVEELIEDFG